MSKEKSEKSVKGIKVRFLNVILMVITIFLLLQVTISTIEIRKKHTEMIDAMNDYSECNKAIRDLCNASDYLSNQARLFSISHDLKYVENYYTELTSLKRRDNAVEIVELSHKGDSPDLNLQVTLSESNLLVNIEEYSMKLICSAMNYEESKIPQELQKIKLSADDLQLSSVRKIELARELLFNEQYTAIKEKIASYSNDALNGLVYLYLDSQNKGEERISSIFAHQIIEIIVLCVLSISLFLIIIVLILNPLGKYVHSIEINEKIPFIGAYELRYIAKSYNSLCDKNAVTSSVLKHKAEHDPLTGLINRDAFDQIKAELKMSSDPIAYLIIDVDFFKQINDQYGHLTGDDVLRNVSTLLMEQFRATDYVARIGGDEFSVIMPKVTVGAAGNIKEKVRDLNNKLQNASSGLPPVSLSVGVAFAESGYNDDLVKFADQALYKVKKNGRCNCSFYKYKC